MIFDKFANLKYKYGNRHFWCKGYYVSTIGRNEKKIKENIQNQLQEDIAQDQISMKEYIDPFLEVKQKATNKTAFVADCERLRLVVQFKW